MPVSAQRKLIRSLAFRFPAIRKLGDSPARYSLYYRLRRVHDEDFRAFTDLSAARPMVYLDVGANQGMSAMSIFTVDPKAKVISFEPSPVHAAHLERLAERFPAFTWHPFGLSDEESSAPLYRPFYRGVELSGLASFDRQAAGGWLNHDRIFWFRPEKLTLEESTLRLKRLDDLQLRPDVVKIDVQGLEEQVLRGGLRTLEEFRPTLLIEDVDPGTALARLLDELGYEPFTLTAGHLVAGLRPSRNVFFVHRSRLVDRHGESGLLADLVS